MARIPAADAVTKFDLLELKRQVMQEVREEIERETRAKLEAEKRADLARQAERLRNLQRADILTDGKVPPASDLPTHMIG